MKLTSIASRTLTGPATKEMIHRAQSSRRDSLNIVDTWMRIPSLFKMPLQHLTAEHLIVRRGK